MTFSFKVSKFFQKVTKEQPKACFSTYQCQALDLNKIRKKKWRKTKIGVKFKYRWLELTYERNWRNTQTLISLKTVEEFSVLYLSGEWLIGLSICNKKFIDFNNICSLFVATSLNENYQVPWHTIIVLWLFVYIFGDICLSIRILANSHHQWIIHSDNLVFCSAFVDHTKAFDSIDQNFVGIVIRRLKIVCPSRR